MSRRTSSVLRLLDRYLGIPVLTAFAILPKRKCPARESIRRIGVLKTAAIGDTLLLASTLSGLRRAYPDAALEGIESLENPNQLLVNKVALSNRINVDGLRLAISRERSDVADSIEPSNPLLHLLWSPRHARSMCARPAAPF